MVVVRDAFQIQREGSDEPTRCVESCQHGW
jgi:hypothetical protein